MKRFAWGVVLLICWVARSAGQNPPPVPTELVAQNVAVPPGSPPRVLLMWQAPAGPWSYRVYRSDDDTTDFDYRGTSPSLSFVDDHVLLSRTYLYRVTSVVRESTVYIQSPPSNIVSITVTSTGPHGSISGIIVADVNNQPIPNVSVIACKLNGGQQSLPPARTNSLGLYQIDADTGTYILRAIPPAESPYRPEFFDNAPEPERATPVHVNSGSVVIANFGLSSSPPATLVHVQGTVRTAEGAPVGGAWVVFMRTIQEMNYIAATTGTTPGLGQEERVIPGLGYTRGVIWSGQTNQFGQYYAHIIAGDNYLVAAAKPGYMPVYFDNKFDPTQADILSTQRDTSGINFALPLPPQANGDVQGIVRDSTGASVPSRVILFPKPPGTQPNRPDAPSVFMQVIHSDTLGFYQFSHVPPGVYNVLAVPYSNFAPGFYRDGMYGVMHWEEADSIVIDESAANANIGLVQIVSTGFTHISGTVTTPGGTPLAGTRVIARTPEGFVAGVGVAGANGAYSIDAIPVGQLTMFSDRNGLPSVQNTISIPPNTFSYSANFVVGSNGSTGVATPINSPYSFELFQCYPNPFNPSTTITYTLGARARTLLKVFNVLGMEVATLVDEIQEPGPRSVTFSAPNLASGLYFYRLEAEHYVAVKRMLLLK